MAYEFKMPMVAESVVEGEIGKWLVKEGDFVKRDQPLVEVLTDKVNVEIPSPYEGYLVKIVVQPGIVAKVGELLAIIGDKPVPLRDIPISNKDQPVTPVTQSSLPPSGISKPQKTDTSLEKKAEPASSAAVPATPPPPSAMSLKQDEPTPSGDSKFTGTSGTDVPVFEVRAMPRARKLAKELGVDLASIRGSGKDATITEADVRAFGSGTPTSPSQPTTTVVPSSSKEEEALRVRVSRVPFRGVRRIVAVNLRKSLDTVAQTLHVDEADVTDLVELREVEKKKAEGKGIKLTYLPFFIKAIVAALKQYPFVNASLDLEANEIILKHYYNIGIATNTEEGLVVPVVKDADKKDIYELAREIAELAEKARTGKLVLADVQDSTFSITNIGSLHGQISFPIINLPNAAIIGIQSITKRPVIRDGDIVARDMVNLSLAFDHRVFDGATASTFTTEIIRRLETPALLFWEEG